jgi:hypothetical protein
MARDWETVFRSWSGPPSQRPVRSGSCLCRQSPSPSRSSRSGCCMPRVCRSLAANRVCVRLSSCSMTHEPDEAKQEQCAERAKEGRYKDGPVSSRLAGLRADRAIRLWAGREVGYDRCGHHDEHGGDKQDAGSPTKLPASRSTHLWHGATIGSRVCPVKAERRGLDATSAGARHPTRRTPLPRTARRPGGSRRRRRPGRLPQRPARTKGSAAQGRRR